MSTSTVSNSPWHQRSYRRLLIDMQVPDWDSRFLSRYDPREALQAASDCGADAVMVYFQSHTGLCNWDVDTGRQHAAFAGRDVMRETLAIAAELDLPVCGYYSVNFNNEAWLENPDWRFVPAAPAMIGGGLLVRDRYGVCCLNHGGYRGFLYTQVGELLERYEFDALFYDMVWWMGVCLCESCRSRYRAESGAELPAVIDWCDPAWCRFQSARERWLTEFAHELRDFAKEARPGISVYHNFALCMMDWTRGLSFESAAAHDFLGGDFYAGRDEQMVVSRLMSNLSESRPVEFMTTVTTNLAQQETLKPRGQLQQESLAAVANGSASLMIASFNPDGSLHAGQMSEIAAALAAREPYDSELGGDPIETVGVYFSDTSKMSFVENGRPLDAPRDRSPADYPHLHAVTGACRKLQRAQLPFGVISRRYLSRLGDYDVVVLPDIHRMSASEADAFRDYVVNGGRLYASRYTSLTGVSGDRHEDFMLTGLFGCRFECIEEGRMVHLECADTTLRDAIAPQRMLSHDIGDRTGVLRLREPAAGARILATLNLPFGHPSTGSVEGRDWASIHSSPPWESTNVPAIVGNDSGKGKVIYSAANIESGTSAAHEALFVSLIRSLLPQRPIVEADAHPSIWITAYDQADRRRVLVNLLSVSAELPVLPSHASLRLSPPRGGEVVAINRLPHGDTVPFETSGRSAARCELLLDEPLTMIAFEYGE